MSFPSLDDMHDAILTNSSEVVKSYLEQGASANQNHARLLPRPESVIIRRRDDDSISIKEDCFAVAPNPTNASLSTLHLAVLNCFKNYVAGERDALGILITLLEKGADASSTADGIEVKLKKGGYDTLSPLENGTSPLQLAILLKKHADSGIYQIAMMTKVSDILVNAPKSKAARLKPPTAPVPTSVIATWKKLLFSEDFSDVKFVCKDDGAELFAHKNVLAAASEYFRSYFLGPWGEDHPNGTWETSNSSDTMKALLSFVYTGELSPSQIDGNVIDLLRVSQEYNLPELLKLCEACCIRKLSFENIKDMLLLAHLHRAKLLQKACHDFVKQHATDILTKPEFMALATENPDVWANLSNAISSDRKRKRS